jgi:hypothetical protein
MPANIQPDHQLGADHEGGSNVAHTNQRCGGTHVGPTEAVQEPPPHPIRTDPPGSDPHPAAQFITEAGVWELKLSHEQVEDIAAGLNTAGEIVGAIPEVGFIVPIRVGKSIGFEMKKFPTPTSS